MNHDPTGFSRRMAGGREELIGTLMLLDRAPKGRDEPSAMDFIRRHDEFEDQAKSPACCAA